MPSRTENPFVSRFFIPCNWDRSMGRDSYLYFVTSGGLTKVGITQNLEQRLKTFQAGNPHDIKVSRFRRVPRSMARQAEKLVHELLAEHAVGREWFRIDADTALTLAKPVIHAAPVAEKQLYAKWLKKYGHTDTGCSQPPRA